MVQQERKTMCDVVWGASSGQRLRKSLRGRQNRDDRRGDRPGRRGLTTRNDQGRQRCGFRSLAGNQDSSYKAPFITALASFSMSGVT